MAGTKRVIEEGLSWVIGGIFLYAGALKLLRPDILFIDLQSYQMLPYRVAYVSSFYLPSLEIFAGVGVMHRWLRQEAAWVLVGLMVVFIIALATAWLRGLDISCGCFGGAASRVNYALLIGRDVLMAAACIFVLYSRSSSNSNESSP